MIFKERLARTYVAGRENFCFRRKGALCSVLLLWLGPTDMAAIFVVALLLFGPEQLPKVARQVGEVMRHMQNTTQSFMLEMDRAAREHDIAPAAIAPSADAPSTDAPSTDALSADAPSAALPSSALPSGKATKEPPEAP